VGGNRSSINRIVAFCSISLFSNLHTIREVNRPPKITTPLMLWHSTFVTFPAASHQDMVVVPASSVVTILTTTRPRFRHRKFPGTSCFWNFRADSIGDWIWVAFFFCRGTTRSRRSIIRFYRLGSNGIAY
jgi:hypothetical protein